MLSQLFRRLFFFSIALLLCGWHASFAGIKKTTAAEDLHINKVWILSIGINNYDSVNFRNCETDALSFADFFYNSALKFAKDSSVRKIVLLGRSATRDSIMYYLKYIISNSSIKDCFIFNFSGFSSTYELDERNDQIYFAPYGVRLTHSYKYNVNNKSIDSLKKQMISLTTLQDQIQLIAADNQLFVTEAGPTQNFRKEFVKALLQNSPSIATILNRNRIIIVPNGFGLDDIYGKNKGPLNYFITSLDSSYNIYNLFSDETNEKNAVKAQLYKQEYSDNHFYNYFDIFFQRDYLNELREFSNNGGKTRGTGIEAIETSVVKKYANNKYALIVGADNYKGRDWEKLTNPVFDAKSIAAELDSVYGFKVKLLIDPPMDSIYGSLRDYYNRMDSTDQFLVYFAGHGDYEGVFFNEGFLVCHDSKPLSEDPFRNTYIPFSKLRSMINNMPAKQVMVVLDVCHGGVFDSKLVEKQRGGSDDNALKLSAVNRLNLWSQHRTRIMLSSMGNKAAYDGTAGNHSPFANLFLQILNTKGANTDGIVTNTSIMALLESYSTHSEGTTIKIEPYMDNFGNSDQEGRFVFIPK
jgi:hypothetical protein